MATHTAAPWRRDTWTRTIDGSKHLVIIGNEFKLAEVESAHDDIENPYTVPADEAEANWHLMASAPLLLEALDYLQANPNDPRAHRMAFDAMKLARGEV